MRRSLLMLVAFLVAAPLFVHAQEEGKAPAKKKEPARILVVTGGHGYDVKEFPQCFQLLKNMTIDYKDTEKTGPGAWLDNIDDFNYDAIVLYTFNQKITDPQKANLMKLLDRGVGLVIFHHAIAAFPEWKAFEQVSGAKYFLKPEQRDGVDYPLSIWKHDVDMTIQVAKKKHPILKGIEDFEIHDESYGKWLFIKDGSQVLLTTDEKTSNRQIAWVRKHGKARIFNTVLGHDKKAYANKSLQQLMANGIRWTTRGQSAPEGQKVKAPKAAKKAS